MNRSKEAELLGGSCPFVFAFYLPLLDQVHEFDTGEQDAGAAEMFEAKNRSGSTFDGSVLLLDDVIQGLDLTNDDWLPALDVDGFESCHV